MGSQHGLDPTISALHFMSERLAAVGTQWSVCVSWLIMSEHRYLDFWGITARYLS